MDLKYKIGFYWVNYADIFLVAEYNKFGKWYACGEEDEINTHIKEVGRYIGSESEKQPSENDTKALALTVVVKLVPRITENFETSDNAK